MTIRWADVPDRRLILPEEGSFTQHLVGRVLDQHGLPTPLTIRMTSFPLTKDAILHGDGTGPFLEHGATSEEELVALPIQEMPDTYPICVLAHRHKENLHLIRSFLRIAENVERAG